VRKTDRQGVTFQNHRLVRMVTRPAHSVFALVIVVHFFPIYGLGQGRTVRSPQ
jgi:hypothetical protein